MRRKRIRYRSNTKLATIPKPVVIDRSDITPKSTCVDKKDNGKWKGKSALPLLKEERLYLKGSCEEYRVRGVAINPEKTNPQLICSPKGSRFLEIEKDITVEPASSYYIKYCADIPVLGVVGSHGKVNDDLKNAVDQLNKRKQSSTSRLGKLMKDAESNYRKYQTPLYCLAATDTSVVTSALSRVWKNKKGQELDGVWIADYESYNVDGVIILSKGKKTLHKIPISVLCDEDVKFIQEIRLNADVSRFAYIAIP